MPTPPLPQAGVFDCLTQVPLLVKSPVLSPAWTSDQGPHPPTAAAHSVLLHQLELPLFPGAFPDRGRKWGHFLQWDVVQTSDTRDSSVSELPTDAPAYPKPTQDVNVTEGVP